MNAPYIRQVNRLAKPSFKYYFYHSILNLSTPTVVNKKKKTETGEFITTCDYCLLLNYVFFQVCVSIGQLIEKTAGVSLSVVKYSLVRPGK